MSADVGPVARRALLALSVLAVALAGPSAALAGPSVALAGPSAGLGAASAPGAPWAAGPKAPSGVIPDVPTGTHVPRSSIAHIASVQYEGGPVLNFNHTHVIFWQPSGSGLTFDPGYMSLIERFLSDVAADSHKTTNTYGLTGQYSDSDGPAAYNSKYMGSVLDTDPLPPNECQEPSTGPGWSVCITDAQLQDEIDHVVLVDHLPRDENDIYFLMTPRGFGSCFDSSSENCAMGGAQNGYCGYHAETELEVLYAFIPYHAIPGHCQPGNPRPNGSTADPELTTISHEQIESITDPLLDGWISSSGSEVADICLSSFGPRLGGSGTGVWNEDIHGDHYYLQEIWSNRDGACEPRARPDSLTFRAPRRTRQNRTVHFAARARDPDGTIVSYRWFFGGGHIGKGLRPSHRFARPGSYRVVLRVTDSWGNWAFFTHTIRVKRASSGVRPR